MPWLVFFQLLAAGAAGAFLLGLAVELAHGRRRRPEDKGGFDVGDPRR